jgi:SAM-dependent methyltransferase
VGDASHWEHVYQNKAANAVSWYTPHLGRSLSWIEGAAPNVDASIIDVGGGESTLIDDLLGRGYRNITVLDISSTALEQTKHRLGALASSVKWVHADATKAKFRTQAFDVWHDRAVFHFLTSPVLRAAYVDQVQHALKLGGFLIVSTFGPQGPTKCSGLDAMRYDANALQDIFGNQFQLLEDSIEHHETPMGTTQEFLYCRFRFRPSEPHVGRTENSTARPVVET